MEAIEVRIERVVDSILEDYQKGREIDKLDLFRHPDRDAIVEIIYKLRRIVYPGYFRDKNYRIYNAKHNLSMLIEDVTFHLTRQIGIVLQGQDKYQGWSSDQIETEARELSLAFFGQIPMVRSMVEKDIQAAFDGDPASYSKDEIIYSYPGLFAITVYRLAHALHTLGVPMLPRIMTEHAHSLTGIDIHPGAVIGEYFFIDHGTGIVVGETTVIGSHAKIYQGVTLGAMTTRGGQCLRGVKRHPTIEDRVTIYAGASILGGETVIGHDCVIGSNAFITRSIAPETTVRIKNQELQFKRRGFSENGDLCPL